MPDEKMPITRRKVRLMGREGSSPADRDAGVVITKPVSQPTPKPPQDSKGSVNKGAKKQLEQLEREET